MRGSMSYRHRENDPFHINENALMNKLAGPLKSLKRWLKVGCERKKGKVDAKVMGCFRGRPQNEGSGNGVSSLPMVFAEEELWGADNGKADKGESDIADEL